MKDEEKYVQYNKKKLKGVNTEKMKKWEIWRGGNEDKEGGKEVEESIKKNKEK